MLRIEALVQARMSSRRLPGKVLRPLCGKPVLEYVIERLMRCRTLDELVVATFVDVSDDPVQALCSALGVYCHRGSLDNVARRYREAVEARGLDAFVRVSGDSPLIDHALVDSAVDLFRTGDWDVVSNVFPRTFPAGQSVEVVSAEALERAVDATSAADELEHPTLFFYRHPKRFRIHNMTSEEDHREVHLSLDTEAYAASIEAIIGHMTRPHWEYSWQEIATLYASVAEASP